MCTNASYQHVPAVTAVGHSTVMTGATPSISGIVGNDWYDRDEKVHVTSVSDAKTQLLGGAAGAAGSSPERLLVSTIGDELKMAGAGTPRVIGVSLKDRAAILPSGHMANGAYWFDPDVEETSLLGEVMVPFRDGIPQAPPGEGQRTRRSRPGNRPRSRTMSRGEVEPFAR